MRPKAKESREVVRARIQAFSAAGYSERKIAAKIGCDRKTVGHWKNKKTVKDNFKPRKSRKLSPSTKRSIKTNMYKKTNAR